MGPLIKTQMTRCIHCTRCVRFATEAVEFQKSVPLEEEKIWRSQHLKSHGVRIISKRNRLMPVGALTSKPTP